MILCLVVSSSSYMRIATQHRLLASVEPAHNASIVPVGTGSTPLINTAADFCGVTFSFIAELLPPTFGGEYWNESFLSPPFALGIWAARPAGFCFVRYVSPFRMMLLTAFILVMLLQ